jgi:hypothetical protein
MGICCCLLDQQARSYQAEACVNHVLVGNPYLVALRQSSPCSARDHFYSQETRLPPVVRLRLLQGSLVDRGTMISS